MLEKKKATIVRSLAGTDKRYVLVQMTHYDHGQVHVQVLAPDAAVKNRAYGYGINIAPDTYVHDYVRDVIKHSSQAVIAESLAGTERRYVLAQLRPAGDCLHGQILSPGVSGNRLYGLSFNVAIGEQVESTFADFLAHLLASSH